MKKRWLIIVLIVLLCLLIPFGVLTIRQYHIQQTNEYFLPVSLNGEADITIEYGNSFDDPGAVAYFYGTKLHTQKNEVEVTIEGTVDAQKIGTYPIKYTAQYNDVVGTAYRNVHVVDTTPPVITLVSDPEHYTLPGEAYQEEGFSAFDEYDGVLTESVQSTEKDGRVIYTVSDYSGNTTTVERQILYLDPVAPQIALNGNRRITIYQGVSFKDPGCTAQDNLDGDISENIVCEGTVNHNVVGSYMLTYRVLDSSGNAASVKRTVTVIPVLPAEGQEESDVSTVTLPDYIEPTGKNIYLTFDDGPSAYTEQLLDVLKKYNVKVTFFVVNTRYIDVIKRASDEGHTIAIHTASHNFHDVYSSEEAYFEDFDYMYNKILTLTGKAPVMMRFPGGSSNTISRFNKGIMTRLTALVKAKGLRIFDWNVDSNDAGGAKTAQEVYDNVITGVQKHYYSVVLQHDIKSFSVEAVEKIIIWGLSNGYTFEALTVNSPPCEHDIAN